MKTFVYKYVREEDFSISIRAMNATSAGVKLAHLFQDLDAEKFSLEGVQE